MVLCASGEVTSIDVIEGLPFGLTEEAVEAARGIEFEPAVHREGFLMSQWIRVEYTFVDGGVAARHYPL